jgi:hypothetical protein
MAGSRHDHQDEYRIPDQRLPENRHEHRDVNVWAVYKFGIALAVLCVVAVGLLYGLYIFFLNREGGALARSESNIDARKLPPSPRLQSKPITDLQEIREAEDKLLNGYGWVDQAHGVTHIPVDRAIDLLAQRGLTARPESAAQPAGDVTVPTESGLGMKVHRPGGPLGGNEPQAAAGHPAAGEHK